ncbi:glycoside hydrolase family 97 protein [Flammeovirgaceae bacterium SG7u.111]|nr:glycoside hydrolase family 97 protein [Flammeovirgaceae bacterium SG7u.132]WPO37763.1 glycoside hydrolase family 97 protein [Flammeovirgaceae bacterium SG7u.111]
MKKLFALLTILTIISPAIAQKGKVYTVISPNKEIIVQVDVADKITYSLQHESQELILGSPISVTLADGTIFGKKDKVKKALSNSVDEIIKPIFWKRNEIVNKYNEIILTFKEFKLTFRVYDDGAAWRFSPMVDSPEILVKEEEVSFNFTHDYAAYVSHTNNNTFQHSYENTYTKGKLSELSDSLTMLPFLVEGKSDLKMVITEADLYDYPGFHVKKDKENPQKITGTFPGFPKETKVGGHSNFNKIVVSREDYIAKIEGTRDLPWRAIIISTEDRELLDNDMVYKLSRAPEGDFSWVKPGKVAWDWWNALNLRGVGFEAGINTASYKYFIDFASKNNFEYVNLDEGWSDQFDLLKLAEDIDVKKIFSYAEEKEVDIILWCVWHTLDKQLDEAMEQFAEWGVKGIKVDFMDRDDQEAVNFYWRVAEVAAKYKIAVNFHGAFKPTGLNRTFPNVINQEAVRGLEYNKFAEPDGTTPDHAATIPFIRMVAGPMDYTPGAMTNANKADFKVVFERPMSQGTRSAQLGMYIVYEAPLVMLADAPTSYEAEPEILEFLSKVPSTWDNTKAIDGEVGEFAVIARQKGDTWYIGGISNWEAREIGVNLSFLGEGNYEATIYKDGPNAERVGEDYVKETQKVTAIDRLVFDVAPGGGFAVILKKIKN